MDGQNLKIKKRNDVIQKRDLFICFFCDKGMYKNILDIADIFTCYNVHPKCAKDSIGMLV